MTLMYINILDFNIKNDIFNFNIDGYHSKMLLSTLISVNKNHSELLFLFFLKNLQIAAACPRKLVLFLFFFFTRPRWTFFWTK
jgi:hypothetical protein